MAWRRMLAEQAAGQSVDDGAHPMIRGDRVVLARVRHEDHRGLLGIVERVYKTKPTVNVRLDSGKAYEAYDCNLDVLEPTGGATQ